MKLSQPIQKLYAFLDRPLFSGSRAILVLLCIPLMLSFTAPLWRISMEAPQYPDGLWMDIYAYKIEGGNEGQHIQEINTLNHYIGMHRIEPTEMADLDWMPFALGILMVLTLRVSAIGNVRWLVDLSTLMVYMLGFMGARFVYRLYVYGHELDPHAPVRIEPFTPVILGTKQIANFTTHSWPQLGSLYIGLFAGGMVALTVVHLVLGRRAAERAERAERERAERAKRVEPPESVPAPAAPSPAPEPAAPSAAPAPAAASDAPEPAADAKDSPPTGDPPV